MKKVAVSLLVAAAVVLSGCGQYPNETGGTLIGAGAGALLGNQFGSGSGRVAATVIGAAAGGFIGNRIGASMDRQDRMQYQQAIESGRGGHWRSRRYPRSYRVIPEGQNRHSGCKHFKVVVTNMDTGRRTVERVKRCPEYHHHDY